MKNIKIFLLLFGFILLTSCALKPIASEYAYVKSDVGDIALDDLGNGSILVYNGANILHKMDNTGRLNIWLDNKPLGQIRPNEYVIIDLKTGRRHFKVLHLDVVNIRSEHEVEIDEGTKVINIWPTPTSNKLEITNELPKNFKKFKYAIKR